MLAILQAEHRLQAERRINMLVAINLGFKGGDKADAHLKELKAQIDS